MTLEEAKALLGSMVTGTGLGPRTYHSGHGSAWVNWTHGDAIVVLDGEFTADQLEAIAVVMRERPK